MYIDSHVHCRDWEQNDKETIAYALYVAEKSGVDAIFDMPNTNPLIISEEMVVKRLELAAGVNSPVFYGLYVGLTSDKEQVRNAVEIYRKYPQVVGLKMFAGRSVGDLSVTNEEDQLGVYNQLSNFGYEGVLVVHCEKESEMDSGLFDFENPITHCEARPEKAEIYSIADQIKFAKEGKYIGKLHIAYVSVPESIEIIKKARSEKLVRISCGATPHHLLLDNKMMIKQNGILYKVNPPLRSPKSRNALFEYFISGDFDILETDHAPPTKGDKFERHMSGLLGLASWPYFIELLKTNGASDELIKRMSFDNVSCIFDIKIKRQNLKIESCVSEYVFDPYVSLKN